MADPLDDLAAAIAEKAFARLRAERAAFNGKNDPTCSPSSRGLAKDDEPKQCGPGGCSPCEHNGSCGASLLGSLGVSRLTPITIRTSKDLAPYIDHTLLKADATRDDVIKMCEEARKYGFATVCLNSSFIPLAARVLQGSSTRPIAVIGFPLGVGATSSKVFETREAVRAGAAEIDMVINQGALKGKDYALVEQDIRAVVDAARPAPVKVILETGTLTRDEKVIACALSKAAGAAFVKTSTGFGVGGATAEDIALMRLIVGADVGVKASGGVRTTEDATKMIAAGASRIGASASVAIVTGVKPAAGKY